MVEVDDQGHMQEICLSAKRGKEVLKVPPEVPKISRAMEETLMQLLLLHEDFLHGATKLLVWSRHGGNPHATMEEILMRPVL